MIRERSQAVVHSKWFLPLFCLALGVAALVGSWDCGPGQRRAAVKTITDSLRDRIADNVF
jgi:hypothetical protein